MATTRSLVTLLALTTPDKRALYAIVVRALELSNLAVQNKGLHITVSGAVEIRYVNGAIVGWDPSSTDTNSS